MRSFALLALVVAAGCGSQTVNANVAVDGSTDGSPADASPDASPDVTAPDVVTPDVARPDVPAPDAPTMPGLPLGSACAADAECASGLCTQGIGTVRVCAQACRRDDDCVPVGPTFYCALDRGGGGRWVCGEVPGANQDPGNACTADDDCLSNACVDGRCHNACATDADCGAGWRCTPFSRTGGRATYCGHAPITGVTVESYTLYDNDNPVDSSTPPSLLNVAPDTVSITWTTQDVGGSDLYAAISRVTAPDNTALVDLRTWSSLREQPLRSIPARYQFNSVMLPTRDNQRVSAGAYQSSHALLNDRMSSVDTRRLRATAFVKRAPGGMMSSGTLLVRVWFVGTRNISAATAMTNTRLVSAFASMRRIYAAAGIGVTVTNFVDITGADATRLSVIDSQAELRELFSRTGGNPDPVLNLMFVRGISSSAGLENAIGVAGTINGPAGINGTTASGVVIGWESTQGGADVLPQVMAHECGHYLGLYHPVESQPGCTAAGQTMCSAFGGVDPISDTPSDATATRNLMYWQAQGGSALSAGQGYVMRAHALVR